MIDVTRIYVFIFSPFVLSGRIFEKKPFFFIMNKCLLHGLEGQHERSIGRGSTNLIKIVKGNYGHENGLGCNSY